MSKGFYPTLLIELCAEIGAELTLEPEFGRAGIITFAHGGTSVFKGTNFGLNPSSAAQIAQDKDFCGKFLAMAGLPCPESQVVFAPKCVEKWRAKNPDLAAGLDPFADALSAAARWGFPLFVKPNEGAEGEGVNLVHSEADLKSQLDTLYQEHDRVLIQKPAAGEDFRLVVLDGELMLAYQRRPLSVTGNGHHTLQELLAQKTDQLHQKGRQAVAQDHDQRLTAYLAGQGLTLSHCPAPGETVQLMANANLSTGGDVIDMTHEVHSCYSELAQKAASAIGLRFAGVDIMSAALDVEDPACTVLEVNAAPGLNNFAATSDEALKRVTALYQAMLHKLEAATNPAA